MTLLAHLFGKLVNAAALLLAVLVLNFCLIHTAPGDPVQVIAGEMGGASAEVIAALRAKYGSIIRWSSSCSPICTTC